jgi:hypothetical protein
MASSEQQLGWLGQPGGGGGGGSGFWGKNVHKRHQIYTIQKNKNK